MKNLKLAQNISTQNEDVAYTSMRVSEYHRRLKQTFGVGLLAGSLAVVALAYQIAPAANAAPSGSSTTTSSTVLAASKAPAQ